MNESGSALAEALDELSDRLSVKYGPHWPMVVSRRGFCTQKEAVWLKRAIRLSSARRGTQTGCLNRVLVAVRKLGIDTNLSISIDSL